MTSLCQNDLLNAIPSPWRDSIPSTTMKSIATTAALLALAFHIQSAFGQKPEAEPPADADAEMKQMIAEIEKLGWTREGEGPLGNRATVAIPRGYRYTGPAGTKKMLEMTCWR